MKWQENSRRNNIHKIVCLIFENTWKWKKKSDDWH